MDKTLTAWSVSLEWEVPERLRRLTRNRGCLTENYLVQWRYVEIAGDWAFCCNKSMGHNSTIRVDNLLPFTKYRVWRTTFDRHFNRFSIDIIIIQLFFLLQFRVVLILSTENKLELLSNESLIIQTLSAGPPISTPVIIRAVAVDHTRISISWVSGPFSNGPIVFYVLQIKDVHRDGYLAVKVPILPNSNFQHLFFPKKIKSTRSAFSLVLLCT